MELKKMESYDWPAVKEIYLQGIATGLATFQTNVPSWEEWDQSHLKHSRFIAQINNQAVGWAALSPVSSRCVYAGVAEVSVYIHEAYRGRKVGAFLLEALVTSSEEQGLWTLQAGVFPENKASIRLHEKFGFRQMGVREKIGKQGDIWRDTVILERRSKTVGID
jgi:L-amino acid N-acyltransferase YncA